MDANSQLRGVIQEMQAEINKLEKENQALWMRLIASSQKAPGPEQKKEDEVMTLGNPGKVPEQPPRTLPHGVAMNSAAAQEHQGNIMIVRRYSSFSPLHSFAANDPWRTWKRHPNGEISEAQGTIKALVFSSIKKQDNEEKLLVADSFTRDCPSRRGSPEPGHGYRDKIKTVSFQLPMDMSSYSKNAGSLEHSPNQTTSQLSTIAE